MVSLQGRCVGNNRLPVRAWYKALAPPAWSNPSPAPHSTTQSPPAAAPSPARPPAQLWAIKTDIFWWQRRGETGQGQLSRGQGGSSDEATKKASARTMARALSIGQGWKSDRSERFQPEIQGWEEWNCSHSDTWKGDRSKIWWWYSIVQWKGNTNICSLLLCQVQQHLKSCLYDAPFGPQRSTQQCVASLLEKYNSVCPTLQFRSDSKRPLSVSACRILSTILSSCTSLLQRQMWHRWTE